LPPPPRRNAQAHFYQQQQASSLEWHPDSRATHHLMNNISNLDICGEEEYTDTN
jgi:hypothetical protein